MLRRISVHFDSDDVIIGPVNQFQSLFPSTYPPLQPEKKRKNSQVESPGERCQHKIIGFSRRRLKARGVSLAAIKASFISCGEVYCRLERARQDTRPTLLL